MYTYKKQKHPKCKPLPTTGGAVHTQSCITGGSLSVLGLRGLEGVPDAGLEQCINRLGLVGGGVLERCHHGAVDVGSRVGQVLLWREEGASIAASSLCVCVCAWAEAAKEGTSLYVTYLYLFLWETNLCCFHYSLSLHYILHICNFHHVQQLRSLGSLSVLPATCQRYSEPWHCLATSSRPVATFPALTAH